MGPKAQFFFVKIGKLQGNSLESWIAKIEEIASEIAQREGCFLYDLEVIGAGKGRIVRVYIDKENGVGIEDCSNVSKGLNLRLDVEDIVPGGMYNLEVSTPGLDRHLKKKWHFEKAIGQKIYVKLSSSLGSMGAVQDKGLLSMKQFEEVLKSVEGEELNFEIRSNPVRIPMDKIEKSKMVFEMKTNVKKSVKKK